MNNETPTPRTDAAKQAFADYTSNPPDGIWIELRDGGDTIQSAFIKNAPPDGWKTSAQLELDLTAAHQRIEKLEGAIILATGFLKELSCPYCEPNKACVRCVDWKEALKALATTKGPNENTKKDSVVSMETHRAKQGLV